MLASLVDPVARSTRFHCQCVKEVHIAGLGHNPFPQMPCQAVRRDLSRALVHAGLILSVDEKTSATCWAEQSTRAACTGLLIHWAIVEPWIELGKRQRSFWNSLPNGLNGYTSLGDLVMWAAQCGISSTEANPGHARPATFLSVTSPANWLCMSISASCRDGHPSSDPTHVVATLPLRLPLNPMRTFSNCHVPAKIHFARRFPTRHQSNGFLPVARNKVTNAGGVPKHQS